MQINAPYTNQPSSSSGTAASCIYPLTPLRAVSVISSELQTRPIPGYPGYAVTSCGQVCRDGRPLKHALAPNRCPRVRICIDGRKSKIAVARLVALAFVPNPARCNRYIHKDHDLANCNASNLQWVGESEYNRWKAGKRIAANRDKRCDSEQLLGPVRRKKEKPVINLGGVPVNDFPGYFITKEGVVYKSDRIVPPQKGNRGNLRIRLRYPTQEKQYLRAGLATLVAEHFVPNPNKYRHVIFKDRDKHNCHADNLAWVDGETFMFWTGVSSKASNEKKKKRFTKEEALRRCKDPWLRSYYETGNETFLLELWNEIDKRFAKRNYKQWPQFRSECYIYFRERLERYSLFYDPLPLFVLYIRQLRDKLRGEISVPLPRKRMQQTDESLRNRNYRVGDTSGQWMWEGLE